MLKTIFEKIVKSFKTPESVPEKADVEDVYDVNDSQKL